MQLLGRLDNEESAIRSKKKNVFRLLIHKGQVSIDNLTEAFKHVVSNSTQFQKRRHMTFVALSGFFEENCNLI